MVGNYLAAIITDMVFIRVFVIGEYLFATVANMVFIRIIMQAHISALTAHAVLPLVSFVCHNHRAATGVLLFVPLCISEPFGSTGVIACIKCSVAFAANPAFCFLGAGGGAARVLGKHIDSLSHGKDVAVGIF